MTSLLSRSVSPGIGVGSDAKAGKRVMHETQQTSTNAIWPEENNVRLWKLHAFLTAALVCEKQLLSPVGEGVVSRV